MENALINIDSKYRNKIIYPNAGKFSIKLGDKLKNVEYIKITSIEFPNFYYTFEQKKIWIRDLKTRMFRENLLGRKMIN